MKSIIRIGGALIMGALFVLGAFLVIESKPATTENTVVAIQEPTNPARLEIELGDVDGNGIADWKDAFDKNAFETIQTPESESGGSVQKDEYIPPSTLTGKFSVAFINDYFDAKFRGENFDNPEVFVGNAVDAIDRSVRSKKHSRLELTIIDTDQVSLRTYGNKLMEIVLSYTFTGDSDLQILQRAMQANEQNILDELIPIQNAYSDTLLDILAMEVPSELAEKHIGLLNGYEAIITNLDAMRSALDDPLYALARIRNYAVDAENLINYVRTITKVLTENGVVYANDEPGAQLYLFDI